jgi:catechol 2,3-dioxygenase-like lactoylglutathione lyase family enzyme
MLEAIGHIALVVQNPVRTAALFKELFASKIVSRKDSDGHEETFVQLGRTWFVLVQADVQRSRTGDHIAFSVSKHTLLACAEKLKQMGQEFLLARSDTALYFYDYDNHVFELDTSDLEKDLANEI